jgi:uncharacterized OB-fold protein
VTLDLDAVTSPAPRAEYVRRLSAGEIPFQRCGDCAAAVFPPRVLCPACGSVGLAWEASSGAGVVHSTTTVAARDGAGHVVCLVDLAEGFRVMSTVLGVPPTAVRIGDPVVGSVEHADDPDAARVVFAPKDAS